MKFKSKNTITVQELRKLLESKSPVKILDVRPKEERDEWKIIESTFVDVYEELKKGKRKLFKNIKFPENVPVVTLCSAGKTSMIAMEQLREEGIEAYSLEGGMRAWTTAYSMAETKDKEGTTVLQIRRTGKGCLSYMIENNGETVVIDPSLNIDVYLSIAESRGWKIKYVLDTHIHADHFSRALELSSKINAKLLFPEQKLLKYTYQAIDNGMIISFGKTTLKTIHSPGHTQESYCYLIGNKSLFTGDTLFTRGVGRPDLKASQEQAKQKASLLFESIQKIIGLDPDIIIYPGHISEPIAFNEILICDTLGNIKESVDLLNYSKDDFITNVLRNIPETPPNYQAIVELNKEGKAKESELIELEAGANRCAIS
ncbi:Glyoxylase, beta-lactamase superfamily II [Tenacibaculum sp. MAR_2009_124]|uniref:MBL fold metallo-hydrolase n=1 Tax=Tenacibaculum sp. MAR_2009_124 TaxID=1250059 RepID=UPI00089C963C|nr:MBL fold metallo-hydrolase [Tenacibaculum sp. MAR_2009_124]SEB76740.1 Glyoxylase, beta-lactamase superfamily II [Tenacibaculum sp. MAR_2009_124]